MPTQITLIGLGRRGASIGLALKGKSRDVLIVGHDRKPAAGRAAQARGAVDRLEWNLPRACDTADLAVLATPLTGMRETLSLAGDLFRPDCVVASLAPLMQPALAWAAEHLSAGVHFVAGNFAANPAALTDTGDGPEGARADLFEKGLWAMAPAQTCPPDAVKLISDLAALLGATPFYVDPAEHDGLSAGTEAVPAVAAAALMRAATRMPAWAERRKLADREFAALTHPAEGDPAGARAALELNRDNVLRNLDAAIEELAALRQAIGDGAWDEVEKLLAEAHEARSLWLSERGHGDWKSLEAPAPELPKPRDFLAGLIGFRRRDEKAAVKKRQ